MLRLQGMSVGRPSSETDRHPLLHAPHYPALFATSDPRDWNGQASHFHSVLSVPVAERIQDEEVKEKGEASRGAVRGMAGLEDRLG